MELIHMERKSGRINWVWADFFKPGYMTYEIYQVLKNENNALTVKELSDKLNKEAKCIWWSLSVLIENGLVVRSDKVKAIGGSRCCLVAMNNSLIEKS